MSDSRNISFEGDLRADDLRFALVVSRFNSQVTEKLLAGAHEAITKCGGKPANVKVVRIPGAFEFPVTARTLANTERYDAIVCLGAVVRGGTPHFDYVAGEAARGIAQASYDSGVPIAFGVLTTDTMQQAEDRAGGPDGNKGFDAAMSVIEMAHVLRRIRQW
jgi:6,7-dimethyl-8-ribityllumazine synthase